MARPLLSSKNNVMSGIITTTITTLEDELDRLERKRGQESEVALIASGGSSGVGGNKRKKSKWNKKRKLNNNSQTNTYDEKEEKLLENVIFGDRHASTLHSQLEQSNNDDSVVDKSNQNKKQEQNDAQLFMLDTTGDCEQQQHHVEGDIFHDTFDHHPLLSEDDDDDDDDENTFRQKLLKPHDPSSSSDVQKAAAWQDEDDDVNAEEIFTKQRKYPKRITDDNSYKQYLEDKFTAIYEPPSWAEKALKNKKGGAGTKQSVSDSESDNDADADDDDEANRIPRTARLYRSKPTDGVLDSEFLRVKKCTHLNHSNRLKISLNCVHFHPRSTVALIGSPVGLVRLFQVDGKVNAHIQSIDFRGYRLCDAQFISTITGREEILIGSDGSVAASIGSCYYYDMIAGKIVRVRLEKGGHHRYNLRSFQLSPDCRHLAACDDNGRINILSAATKEHVAELKMNGEVNCVAYTNDANYLLAHGKDNGSQVYVFDVRQVSRCATKCVNRFTDLGTVEATSMALSDQMCAIGSNMGVVNLYHLDDVIKRTTATKNKEPQPIKSVMNLTTRISSLRFNHDGQLLFMCSDQCNDAIRFVNTHATKVYKNFPAFVAGAGGGGPNNNKTYGRIYGIDISPHSGYASFATGSGTAHLFRIHEYGDY